MQAPNTGVSCRDEHDKAILGRQDIDPVEDICKLLEVYKHPQPRAWLDCVNKRLFEPDILPDEKRYIVNQQWHMIIGLVEEEDTSQARYCLVDRGPLDVWLILFKQSVLPVVLRYSLPNASFY